LKSRTPGLLTEFFSQVPWNISMNLLGLFTKEEFFKEVNIGQEAIIRLLVEKGIFSKEEFLKMVEVVNLEIKKMV
jgi:hypothetical protein